MRTHQQQSYHKVSEWLLDTIRHGVRLILLLTVLHASAHVPADTIHAKGQIQFIENLGQWEPAVCFKARMQNATFFAERNAFTFVVSKEKTLTEKDKRRTLHHNSDQQYHAYRMRFEGCAQTQPEGHNPATDYENYYIGKDRNRWRSNVRHYEELTYQGLYAGIDLHLYSAEGTLKYDFYIHPGANPSQIAMRYEGCDGLDLQKDGSLRVRTSAADIIECIPNAFQPCDTGRHEIEAKYVVKGSHVSIQLSEYDPTLPVIIDPYLYFSTYTGSTADNWGTTATYDSYKNTYTAGLVFDVGYPSSLGAFNEDYVANSDIGIFKFDTSGSQRIFATYLGGSQGDMPHSMFVNEFDELVLFGTTGSDDFPVSPNAFDTSFNGGTYIYYEFNGIAYPNGSDIFVSRFSEDGSRLPASTYVGGSENDGLNFRHAYNDQYSIILMGGNDSLYFNYGDGARGELITDDRNNVYVGSTTFSDDFPVSDGAIQGELKGMQEGVVFKLDYNLSNMIWCTYLGGESDDAVYSIEVDSVYNLLACGGTCSPDFPTTDGTYKTTYQGGTTDGFACKISYNGERLMASTFFGSDAYDQCYFVRRGKNSDVFLFGQTKATGSTLIHNANYNVPNSGQFIAHLTPDMDSLIWSTVFGTGNGQPNISPTAFVADVCNRVYAVGWGRDFVGYYDTSFALVGWRTRGTTGMEVTPDAYEDDTDGQDFYIISISADAAVLDYATFFGEVNDYPEGSVPRYSYYDHTYYYWGGGDHVDGGTSRFDRLGTLYQSVCGSCGGTNGFPTTPNAWSAINGSNNCNNAVFRFSVHSDFPKAEFSRVPTGCAPYTVAFNNTSRGTSFYWDFGDGATSTDFNPTHTYDTGGEYTVRLITHLEDGCSEWDTASRTVRVLQASAHRMPTQHNCVEGSATQIGVAPTDGCRYRWSGGTVSDNSIANPTVGQAGTYILQIIQDAANNDEGCIETDTFSVVYYSLLDTLLLMPPVCDYDSFGVATAIVNSNVADEITYVWDDVPSDQPSFGPALNSPVIHTLRVATSLCAAERQFKLYTPSPSLRKTGDSVLCGACNGYIRLAMSDPRGMAYNYLWNDGSTATLRTDLCEGTYAVAITDSNLCTYYDTTVIVSYRSFDSVRLWADDSVVWEERQTRLHAEAPDGCSYRWQPSNLLNDATLSSPTATLYKPTTFALTITDKAGCTYNGSIFVDCDAIDCGRKSIFIPNTFTPNDDGMNDRLYIRNEDPISKFHIAIFSRWGELVYESDDIAESWDGRYNGNKCLPGVYMYTCRFSCAEGKDVELKGDITLIR